MEKLIVNNSYKIMAMMNGMSYEAVAVYLGYQRDDVLVKETPQADTDICEFACEFGITMSVPFIALEEIENIALPQELSSRLTKYAETVSLAIEAKNAYVKAREAADTSGELMFEKCCAIPTWVLTKKVGELIEGIYVNSDSHWEIYFDAERKTLVIAEYLRESNEYAMPDYLLERSAEEIKCQRDEDGYPIAFAYLYHLDNPTDKRELERVLGKIKEQIFN